MSGSQYIPHEPSFWIELAEKMNREETMENKTTIESILPASVLVLIRKAPANPMTRGQVRASTNLVYPDEVNTTEGIEKYVLENYTPRPGQVDLRQEVVFNADVSAHETEYGRVDYSQRCSYHLEFSPSREDLEGCHTREDFINRINRLLSDHLTDGGPSDYGDMETGDNQDRDDSDDWEQSTDGASLWEEHKQSIARAMGMELEDIENE